MTDSPATAGTQRVDLATCQPFTLADMRVNPAECLVEMQGQRETLQPRIMQVLVALAEDRPKVVSRDQLIERCWGGTIVGDDAINRCIVTLRKLANKYDPAPFSIETLPRVGHRLQEGDIAGPRARQPVFRWKWLGALAFIALLLVIGWHVVGRNAQEQTPTTIAVLPFADLSGDDPFLAAGMTEELLSQLARDPQFRVAGRILANQMTGATDVQGVGKSLGVDYAVEGSVRQNSKQVRIDVALVNINSGMRIWSDTYNGSAGDELAIQQAIGNAIAGALSQQLLQSPQRREMFSQNPEAYRSYLLARGMLHTRNPQVAPQAVNMLEDAVRRDPQFGAAWSQLAYARRLTASLGGHEKIVELFPSLKAQAAKGVSLAPHLAETHGINGVILGYFSPQAQASLRKAGTLAPNDAEAQLLLATASRISGEFDEEIAIYRRAHMLEPNWYRPTRDLAVALAESGKSQEAEQVAKDGFPGDPISQDMLIARIAWLRGDLSEAAKRWASVAAKETFWANLAMTGLYTAKRTLGLPVTAPVQAPVAAPELNVQLGRRWIDSPPTVQLWERQNRNEAAALVYKNENIIIAKMLLTRGAGRQLITQYDGPIGLLGYKKGQAIDAYNLHIVPLVALALRQSGRQSEARQLLNLAKAKAEAIHRRGTVPYSFEVDMAAVAAMQGRAGDAVSALRRARAAGWTSTSVDDLPRFADEPAFASLRQHPGFQTLLRELEMHIARERRETLALGL